MGPHTCNETSSVSMKFQNDLTGCRMHVPVGTSKLNLKILEVPIRYQEINRFQHVWLLLKMIVYGFFRLKAV